MQALDMLLGFVLIGFALWHCYKKGKFPFRFLSKNRQAEITDKKGGTQMGVTPPPSPNVAQSAPQSAPYMSQYPPYIVNGMGNIQSFPPLTAPQQTATGTHGIDLIKLIPWTIDDYDPLPFDDTRDFDKRIQNDLPQIGLTLNAEITAIQCDGYSVTNVNVVTLPIDDGIRLLFVLSCCQMSETAKVG